MITMQNLHVVRGYLPGCCCLSSCTSSVSLSVHSFSLFVSGLPSFLFAKSVLKVLT